MRTMRPMHPMRPQVWEAASQHASSSSSFQAGGLLGQAAKEVAKPGKDNISNNTGKRGGAEALWLVHMACSRRGREAETLTS